MTASRILTESIHLHFEPFALSESIITHLFTGLIMANDERPTPLDSDIPGGWPQTPAVSRQQSSSYVGRSMQSSRLQSFAEEARAQPNSKRSSFTNFMAGGEGAAGAAGAAALGVGYGVDSNRQSGTNTVSSDDTVVASRHPSEVPLPMQRLHPTESIEAPRATSMDALSLQDEAGFAALNTAPTEKPTRPTLGSTPSRRAMTEDDVVRHLSRRNTNRTGNPILSRAPTEHDADELAEINKLMGKMFGQTRQAQSEEEQTRHVGVVWKNLTVKGEGLGASLIPTFGDVFLRLPRAIAGLLRKGPRKASGKPPVKTIINNFSGCLKPGEMCLVLGRPGSGCSTMLKVLGNSRAGYKSVDGEVTYGGADAKTMLKKYRSEITYQPEEDLAYATLTVQKTLEFALKFRTPDKNSRNDGETAKQYVASFLSAVVKLFWIEHTLKTKVGNEFVRGVSGGERKRVSIAEAMVTKASTACWDNSTKGLDASTALEFVESLRSLTNMAHISTAVALYQAGERLYHCFDKVMLIDNGRCAYFGHAEDAAQYFEDLGFVRPDRWTTADFLTSVTDEHERHVREGWEDRIPRSAEQFGETFAKSAQHQRNIDELETLETENKIQAEERHRARTKHTKKKNYTIPFYKQVLVCTQRQWLVMIGDKQSLGGKWGGIIFQGLIVGSLFFNMPDTTLGVFPRGKQHSGSYDSGRLGLASRMHRSYRTHASGF